MSIKLDKYKMLSGLDFPPIESSGATPIFVRSQENAFVYVEDPYIVCRSKMIPKLKVTVGGTDYYVEPVEHIHASWWTVKRYGFGTYEWKAKMGGVNSGEEYAGGFEYHHGFPLEGLITIIYLNGVLKFWTSWGGNQTQTNITGVDVTVEHTYRIQWTSSSVQLWIDGVSKAIHTTNIPQAPMSFFSEACAYRGTATQDAYAYFKLGSLRKL